MITIRDSNMRPVAKGPAQDLIPERARLIRVERVDIYPSEGPALLGVTWGDGSTGICDWLSSRECVDWVKAQPWARGITRLHFAQGARP